MKDGNAEFDARGVVIVLHGPPKLRSVLNLPGIAGNESWAYPDRLDGDTLLFHFVRPYGSVMLSRSRASSTCFALSGQARFMAPTKDTTADGRPVLGTYGASLTAQTSQELFVSREPMSPIYTRMFNEGRNGAAALQQAERDDRRAQQCRRLELGVPLRVAAGRAGRRRRHRTGPRRAAPCSWPMPCPAPPSRRSTPSWAPTTTCASAPRCATPRVRWWPRWTPCARSAATAFCVPMS